MSPTVLVAQLFSGTAERACSNLNSVFKDYHDNSLKDYIEVFMLMFNKRSD